jgi:hypothetical protein
LKYIAHAVCFFLMLICGASLGFSQNSQPQQSKERVPENPAGEKSAQRYPQQDGVLSRMEQEKLTEDAKLSPELSNPDDFLARTGRGDREAQFRNTFPSHAPRVEEELPVRPQVAFVRAGFGLFSTPHAEGWYGRSFPVGDINAHAAFEKSSGYVPRAEYSRFAFDLTGGSYVPGDMPPLLARSRVEGAFHFFSHEYNLFANNLKPVLPRLEFDRSRRDISYVVGLLSRKNELADYEIRIGADHTLLWENETEPDSLRSNQYHLFEATYFIDAEYRLKTEILPVLCKALMYFSDNTNAIDRHNPWLGKLIASGTYEIDNDFAVSGDVRFILSRGTADKFAGRLGGTLRGFYSFEDDFTVFAELSRDVIRRTISSLLELNPYASLDAGLEHQFVPVRIEGGIGYDNRLELSGRVSLGYDQVESFPIFVRKKDQFAQQWDVDYSGSTRLYRLAGELTYRPTTFDELYGKIDLTMGSNSAHDGRVPYLPDFEVGALYRHEFPFRLDISFLLQWLGERPTESTTLPSVLVLSFNAEYRFHQHLGAFLSIRNLTAQKYEAWPGYSALPFFPMFGITARL